ncbi:MAG: GNAT family N-acetyltransferase [Nanoarchaeales archaeon]|nr:GNAT family N-acetyltransferase [Nanoarchaeales archaeon]
MKFEQFTNINELTEWMNIAKLAGLKSTEFVENEVKESILNVTNTNDKNSITNNTINLNIGIAYCMRNQDNKIIGTSFLKQIEEYDSSNQITIFHIAIDETLRGQGLGKQLMNETFKCAKRLKLSFANLYTTTQSNFYLNCGMKKYGEFPDLIKTKQNKKFSRKYLYINLDTIN